MNQLLTALCLFSMLLEHAQSPSGVEGGRYITKPEMQIALAALDLDGSPTARAEVEAVRRAAMRYSALLTVDAKLETQAWLLQHAESDGGGGVSIRRADAFRVVLSWMTYARVGKSISAPDAELLLTLVGRTTSPLRVFEVAELARSASLSAEAKGVLNRWLVRHRVKEVLGALGRELSEALDGLLWLSESDRPIQPITFPELRAWPIDTSRLRRLLGEDPRTVIEPVAFDHLFSWVDAALESDLEEERTRAARFAHLRAALSENLIEIRAYKIGAIDRDLIVLGRTSEGDVVGIATRVIET